MILIYSPRKIEEEGRENTSYNELAAIQHYFIQNARKAHICPSLGGK